MNATDKSDYIQINETYGEGYLIVSDRNEMPDPTLNSKWSEMKGQRQ